MKWKHNDAGNGEYVMRDGYRAEVKGGAEIGGIWHWTVHDRNAGGTILLLGHGVSKSMGSAKQEAMRFVNRRAKR